jgi:hypothetical protein
MTTELPERWHAEVRLLLGGTEHVLASPALRMDAALSVVAEAIDVLGELRAMLDDADAPAPEPGVYRELWHWRVSWTDTTGVEHVCQSWTGDDAAELWTQASEAVESLADLREILRQVRGPRPPRMLGEDAPTWDDQLAAYDAKAAESAARDAARVSPTDRRD